MGLLTTVKPPALRVRSDSKKETTLRLDYQDALDDVSLTNILHLCECCPQLVTLDEQSPLNRKDQKSLLRILARNAYLWLLDPDYVLEEPEPEKVNWWERDAVYWAGQTNLENKRAGELLFYKQSSNFDGSRATRTSESCARTLCIEQAGPEFLKACLEHVIAKGSTDDIFVFNANTENRWDEGYVLRSEHVAIPYMEILA
ncbi:MAG: hypothetical protein ACRCXC_05640 [Legionella sp.]